MIHRTILAGIVSVLLGTTAATFAAAPTTAPAALEVRDVLAISSKVQLLEMTLAKFESLARLLAKVSDESSAKNLRPAIERCYFEMEMLGIRLQMMGPPTAADRQQALATRDRYEQVKETLVAQVRRLLSTRGVPAELSAVIPPLREQFAGLSVATARSLESTLQTLRSQIELYKLQHLDNIPDFRKQAWGQFVGKTDANGAVGDRGRFGPYLNEPPVNPLTGATKILLVRSKPKPDFHYADGDAGFIIEESTGRVWGLTADGKIFDDGAAMSSAGF
jgi:hypothetical protein